VASWGSQMKNKSELKSQNHSTVIADGERASLSASHAVRKSTGFG
jgi:hypothetical protein